MPASDQASDDGALERARVRPCRRRHRGARVSWAASRVVFGINRGIPLPCGSMPWACSSPRVEPWWLRLRTTSNTSAARVPERAVLHLLVVAHLCALFQALFVLLSLCRERQQPAIGPRGRDHSIPRGPSTAQRCRCRQRCPYSRSAPRPAVLLSLAYESIPGFVAPPSVVFIFVDRLHAHRGHPPAQLWPVAAELGRARRARRQRWPGRAHRGRSGRSRC